MAKKIDVSTLWEVAAERVVLDVRTPAEFQKGHIPFAKNLPLFTDEERAIVGTAYVQESPYEAMLKGLDYVGPKMRQFLEKVAELAPNGRLLLYCWRGGKRSSSMGWLFETAGLDVLVLEGGYKAYRRYVLDHFALVIAPIIILGGRTGCGKTLILKALGTHGEQIIDLEGLARHKGSAFGALGEEAQPSVEFFENQLFEQYRQLDPGRVVWVENESRSIGRVYIPQGFWDQMKKAPLINIEVPFHHRLSILVDGYSQYPKEELLGSFKRIGKRLGPQHLTRALDALEVSDFKTAAEIALHYYDKSYQYMLDNNKSPNIHILELAAQNAESSAKELIDYAKAQALTLV